MLPRPFKFSEKGLVQALLGVIASATSGYGELID